MKKTDWLNKLDSKNGESTRTFAEEHQDKIDKVKLKFLNEIKEKRYPKRMAGAFSPEAANSDAYIEEIIKPESGGHFYKLYGINYLYKGNFEDWRVHGIQMPKAIISEILSQTLQLPLIGLGFLFTFLITRKKFYWYVEQVLDRIDHRATRWYDIPENEYNDYAKELKRAVKESVDDSIIGRIFWKSAKFVILVLETDNAYRLRVQDAIEGAYINYGKDYTIFNVLDILISREVRGRGIPYKWRFIRLGARVILFLSPGIRKLIDKILRQIDVQKVKMDEADWYFSLRFKSYNFKGLDELQRLAERDRLDKLNGHIYLI